SYTCGVSRATCNCRTGRNTSVGIPRYRRACGATCCRARGAGIHPVARRRADGHAPVVDNDGPGIIAVSVATVTTPAPTAVGIRPSETAAVVGRSPAPVTPIIGIVPTAAPTEAPATHAPAEAEAKSATVAIAVPRTVAIPGVEPRVV